MLRPRCPGKGPPAFGDRHAHHARRLTGIAKPAPRGGSVMPEIQPLPDEKQRRAVLACNPWEAPEATRTTLRYLGKCRGAERVLPQPKRPRGLLRLDRAPSSSCARTRQGCALKPEDGRGTATPLRVGVRGSARQWADCPQTCSIYAWEACGRSFCSGTGATRGRHASGGPPSGVHRNAGPTSASDRAPARPRPAAR